MKELDVCNQGCIEGSFLIKGTFSTFRYDRHGQLLLPYLPQRAINMYNRWWAEEPFLASIGLSSDRGVQADDSSHRYDSAAISANLFADYVSDFRMVVFSV